MRFHQTITANSKRLRRLAALLCALADLVERAADRSHVVCWFVLWLIHPAEALARGYVMGIAPGAALPQAPLRPAGAAAEARRLAQTLRHLAATLAALADRCRGPRPAANHLPITPARPPLAAAAIAWLDSSQALNTSSSDTPPQDPHRSGAARLLRGARRSSGRG